MSTWEFAMHFKKIRKRKRLTQREWAELIGVPLYNIKSWENGRAKPNPHNINIILAAMDEGNALILSKLWEL